MNGRLYDPAINRMVSVDPVIQFPDDMQSYNAYSYVMNNPMVDTDPSGFAELCDIDCAMPPTIVTPSPWDMSPSTSSTLYAGSFSISSVWDWSGNVNSGLQSFADNVVAQRQDYLLPVVYLAAVTSEFLPEGTKDLLTLRIGKIVKSVKTLGKATKEVVETISKEKKLLNEARVDGAADKVKDVEKYEVGTYDALKGKSLKGDGLDIHHAMQQKPASQVVEGYNPATGPSIALPRGEHSRLPTLKGEYEGSARDLLAKDVRDLRNMTNAPNSAIRDLVELNKQMYPSTFKK